MSGGCLWLWLSERAAVRRVWPVLQVADVVNPGWLASNGGHANSRRASQINAPLNAYASSVPLLLQPGDGGGAEEPLVCCGLCLQAGHGERAWGAEGGEARRPAGRQAGRGMCCLPAGGGMCCWPPMSSCGQAGRLATAMPTPPLLQASPHRPTHQPLPPCRTP